LEVAWQLVTERLTDRAAKLLYWTEEVLGNSDVTAINCASDVVGGYFLCVVLLDCRFKHTGRCTKTFFTFFIIFIKNAYFNAFIFGTFSII